jgi:hypothetical protein
LLPLFLLTGLESFPQIGPFDVGLMKEVTGATIVGTPAAGKSQLIGYVGIGLSHFPIEDGELVEKQAFG